MVPEQWASPRPLVVAALLEVEPEPAPSRVEWRAWHTHRRGDAAGRAEWSGQVDARQQSHPVHRGSGSPRQGIEDLLEHFLVVGAGFSGAVIARELASRRGARVTVIDKRHHVAGNCHTERDPATGVMVHVFGPHIFNTNNDVVWQYVNRFDTFKPFVNRVRAVTPRGVFGLPINLMTINQFFGVALSPAEARAFVHGLGDPSIGTPANFEEQALKMLGRELYENFFRGYTLKQWGCDPRELPASVLKRLPVRFNYDDNYYDRRHQGIPEHGYTHVVQRILEAPGVEVTLGVDWDRAMIDGYDRVFFTGPLDEYFGHGHGRLGYRTVTFERIDGEGDIQGNAVINYTSRDVPWTRVHEHKHFAPWETHDRSVAFREFSRETGPDDTPFYPKRLPADKALLGAYRRQAEGERTVTFLGRLATYRYMDMETVIGEALEYADRHFAMTSRPVDWPHFPNSEQ